MSVTLDRLDRAELAELTEAIRDAGVSGAGGAGFPTHAKWDHLDDVSALMVNLQESEPNYYMDKWIARRHAADLAELFDALLDHALDLVAVCPKASDRSAWCGELEAATDATVYDPEDLPIDPDEESGVVFAYTDDRYEYGMESVLLKTVADTVIGSDLPMTHGWIVQNPETLLNLHRALTEGPPVTRKYVHVDGLVSGHRFLDVPVGTTAAALLEAAGTSAADLPPDVCLADGGPGWCFEIEDSPDEFGVTKRSNCVLVLDQGTVAEHTLGNDRINVLEAGDWSGAHETTPTRLDPDAVRVPLLTNPGFGDLVAPGRPVVEPGDRVHEGDSVAVPADDGISNTHHASIDGTVTAVTDTHVEISRE